MFIFTQISYLSLNSFLKYYKEITNLLFWVLWACLAASTRSNSPNLHESLIFICKQKMNLIPRFIIDIAF